MTFSKFVAAGFTVAMLLSPAGLAVAQEAPAEEAAPAAEAEAATGEPPVGTASPATAGDPRNNWLKVCEPLENGEKACLMRQVVVLQNGQFLGSFELRDDPRDEYRFLASAAVPVGVLLPAEMVWQIDAGRPSPKPFFKCDPVKCMSLSVLNRESVDALKKGAKLKLTAKNAQNQDLVVEINLAGFTAAFDSETALTFDEFREQSTGEAALEKQLQDKAEALRRQLSEGAAAESAPEAAAAAQ
ncbi:MAG TPA: invasion associated locus B family protein [Devosiaceae bacterium]|jgi:invasion protein IalB|nr:invasion associated locus B family protein [Devosiaceae bacterium]